MPLLEKSADEYYDYEWPYGSYITIHVNNPSFQYTSTMNIYVNNLPVNSQSTIYISPIKALPLVTTTMDSAKVTINGKSIDFSNFTLSSGEYFEYIDSTDCRFFTKTQNGTVQCNLSSDELILKNGENTITVEYSMDVNYSAKPRVKFTAFGYSKTIISRGDDANNIGLIVGLTILCVVLVGGIVVGILIFKGVIKVDFKGIWNKITNKLSSKTKDKIDSETPQSTSLV